MPTVNKQQAAGNPPPKKLAGGILDRIVPVADVARGGVSINIYGRNGSGKTTFACSFPKPLLLVGCEDGTESVKKVTGVEFVRVNTCREVAEVAEYLPRSRYASAVLDTATSLQDIVLREILNLEELPVQLGWGTVKQDQYRARSEKTKELIRKFLRWREQVPSANLIILAQEKNHSAKDGEGGGDSEILAPFVASSLGASLCGWLQDGVDFICQTYTRERVDAETTTVAGRSVTINKKTGEIEFCLRTQKAHPVYAAKLRVDKGIKVPDVLVDPSYDKLMRHLEGKAK